MLSFSNTLMDLTIVDGEVLCQDGRPFNAVAYSKFKYGYLPPGVEYGTQLAQVVCSTLFAVAGDEPIVVVSAPYKFLPTASHVIAQALVKELSRRAVLEGREPPVLIPFHKARPGSDSYAKSSEADRLKSLATLGLHIDESLINGRHVVVVDDIRITGSAQRATASYLESLDPSSIWYLHAARLPEDVGRAHPALENQLNQTVPHSLEGFLQQEAAGLFRLNTRAMRFILECQDQAEFDWFVQSAPTTLLLEIYYASMGNGQDYYHKYQSRVDLVDSELQRRADSQSIQPAPSA